MLPVQHPAEAVKISPEDLLVANSYLEGGGIQAAATTLGVEPHQVAEVLSKPVVKGYIDRIFSETGFNNRWKIRKALDMVISHKFREMDETGVGSSKDIAELLALSHKMSMEVLDREIALEKVRASSVRNQVNVQINDAGSNYGRLLEKLVGGNDRD